MKDLRNKQEAEKMKQEQQKKQKAFILHRLSEPAESQLSLFPTSARSGYTPFRSSFR